jgi:hypothetical protein
MSISITNATRGVVRNFNIIQPQFWYIVTVPNRNDQAYLLRRSSLVWVSNIITEAERTSIETLLEFERNRPQGFLRQCHELGHLSEPITPYPTIGTHCLPPVGQWF